MIYNWTILKLLAGLQFDLSNVSHLNGYIEF